MLLLYSSTLPLGMSLDLLLRDVVGLKLLKQVCLHQHEVGIIHEAEVRDGVEVLGVGELFITMMPSDRNYQRLQDALLDGIHEMTTQRAINEQEIRTAPTMTVRMMTAFENMSPTKIQC